MTAAFLLLLPSCAPGGPAGGAPPEEAVRVRTGPVTRGPVDHPIVAAGTVAPRDEWNLAFKVGGLLADVRVRTGDPVRKGQVLATLDPTELAAGVRQAGESLDKACSSMRAWAASPSRPCGGDGAFARRYIDGRSRAAARR